jgi:glucokinase
LKNFRDSVLAIDIGGTKYEIAVVSFTGEILYSKKYNTPSVNSSLKVFDSIKRHAVEMLSSFYGSTQPSFCSIGCGGPMDKFQGHVSPINIPAFREFPLVTKLSEALNLKVYLDNDAKALTLAEKWLGAAKKLNGYLSMVVSTGIGGGIYLNGRLLDGNSGNCGHIGHINVIANGHLCGCGAFGCLEAEASGTAIKNIYNEAPRDVNRKIKRRTGMLVGRAVGSVFNLLDINQAFVAGSVALGYKELFFESAQMQLDKICKLDFTKEARISPSELSDRGPILGAAAIGLFEENIISF